MCILLNAVYFIPTPPHVIIYHFCCCVHIHDDRVFNPHATPHNYHSFCVYTADCGVFSPHVINNHFFVVCISMTAVYLIPTPPRVIINYFCCVHTYDGCVCNFQDSPRDYQSFCVHTYDCCVFNPHISSRDYHSFLLCAYL